MKTLKVKVKFNEHLNSYLEFIYDTKSGKFTSEKPTVVDFNFRHIKVQDQIEEIDSSEINDENLLFGISS